MPDDRWEDALTMPLAARAFASREGRHMHHVSLRLRATASRLLLLALRQCAPFDLDEDGLKRVGTANAADW